MSANDLALALAIYGAALSSFLAFRSFLSNRTRIDMSISNDFRMGDEPGMFRWLMLDVTISNLSDRPVSITEYGFNIRLPDGSAIASTTMHVGTMENGHVVITHPLTQQTKAIEVPLPWLMTPQNLPARSSVQGWMAFEPDIVLSRDGVATYPMQLVLRDQHGKSHCHVVDGLGPSRDWRALVGDHRPRIVSVSSNSTEWKTNGGDNT